MNKLLQKIKRNYVFGLLIGIPVALIIGFSLCVVPPRPRLIPAVPNFAGSVYSFLTGLEYGQDAFMMRVKKDEDNDRVFEYGNLRELFDMALKYDDRTLPWSSSISPRNEVKNGETVAQRYVYKLYIPANIDDAEKYWCAYAWPVEHSKYTRKTFFANEKTRDRVYYCIDKKYQGLGNGPRVGDAYKGESFKSEIDTSKWKVKER